MDRGKGVITRSKGSKVFYSLEEKKKTYLYPAIKKKDAQSGYPIRRFCYQRNGHRVYYPRKEDMPKEVSFPHFFTEEEKAAAEEKYKNLNFYYMPDEECASKWHSTPRQRGFFVHLGSCQDAVSAIPELINKTLWLYLLGDD